MKQKIILNKLYIFFDFDGTLVNTIEGTAQSAKYGFEKLDINIDTKITETIYWNWPYRTGETEDDC